MTALVIHLPDELEQRARSAGLLSDSAIQTLLEEAMRRQSGRRLQEIAQSIHAAGIAPMPMEEIDAEVKAVRALRRARLAREPDAGCS
ncbi:MAG: hypothetical protein EXR07_00605 [Acetobacteraceae bacterium]|nr:hypothetical protein [Acetobacteraceae bacterium]